MFSDTDIRAAIDTGVVSIDPFCPELIQPSSIDVRLSNSFRVFNNHRYTHIDPAEHQPDLTSLIESNEFTLHPGEFVLASTVERVTLSTEVASCLNGKSSLGRLGLLIHSTAGFIDPGFSGQITLELSNVANLPIVLHPGMRIGQLCLFQLKTAATNPYGSAQYGSRYQHQVGPQPSRSWREWRPIRRLS